MNAIVCSDALVSSNSTCNDMSVSRSVTDSGITIYGQSAIYLSVTINIQIKINVKVVGDINCAAERIQNQIASSGADFASTINTNLNVIGSDVC